MGAPGLANFGVPVGFTSSSTFGAGTSTSSGAPNSTPFVFGAVKTNKEEPAHSAAAQVSGGFGVSGTGATSAPGAQTSIHAPFGAPALSSQFGIAPPASTTFGTSMPAPIASIATPGTGFGASSETSFGATAPAATFGASAAGSTGFGTSAGAPGQFGNVAPALTSFGTSVPAFGNSAPATFGTSAANPVGGFGSSTVGVSGTLRRGWDLVILRKRHHLQLVQLRHSVWESLLNLSQQPHLLHQPLGLPLRAPSPLAP